MNDETPKEITADKKPEDNAVREKTADVKPESKTAKEKVVDKKLEDSRRNTREWIKDLGIAAIIAVLFLQFFMPTIVREHSMENTLLQNDYVFVSRRYYTWFKHDITRGDIIVFKSDLTTSSGSEKLLVKRIIGIPGDKVSIADGEVYVNGEPSDESFTKDGRTGGSMAEVTVPAGHVFVMGDNRQNSTDSRSPLVGFVDIKTIKGKVVFRLLPFKRLGLFD
ncbi:MAG: signal peptidase I [Firmicutes bacterium]|nr:signal peptidase I [Bacillota bacterium]